MDDFKILCNVPYLNMHLNIYINDRCMEQKVQVQNKTP